MADNPVGPLAVAALMAAFIALMQGGAVVVLSLDDCGLIDVLTGCGPLKDQILGILALGIIPGAPLVVNLLFGTFGIILRGMVLWSFIELIRGT